MVERINKPEAPVPHRVEQSKQTKEDRHQQHNPRDDAERERKKRLEQKEWQKFGRRTIVIKPLRVERAKIRQCLFRSVSLHSGIGTLRVDVVWVDGKKTQGALMLVRQLEDFLKLRKLAQGEVVPNELWVRGPQVEMGIPQTISEAGALSGREIKGERATPAMAPGAKASWLVRIGLVGRDGRVNWGLVLMYGFLLVLAVAAVVALVA